MKGRFVTSADVEREQQAWGETGWIARPSSTGAGDLVFMEVTIAPGGGHNFHFHPNQEEVIYVLSGQVEQWLEDEMMVLGSGDSIYIDAGTVHASFNVFDTPAKLAVVLGPCDGDDGYIAIDVGDQAPWNSLR